MHVSGNLPRHTGGALFSSNVNFLIASTHIVVDTTQIDANARASGL